LQRIGSDEGGEMRTFRFTSDGSDKFWHIHLLGKSVKVTFGRVGTPGQTRTWHFTSPAQAKRAYERRIQEKLAEGYTETTGRRVGAPGMREPP
jgi:predicted DNA-binding WGR domain protein